MNQGDHRRGVCPCDLSLPPPERLGARIRELRVDAELTQKQLAARCGVDRVHVNRWEHGKHVMQLETMTRIAQALEIDVATIMVVWDEDWLHAGRMEALRAREGKEAAA